MMDVVVRMADTAGVDLDQDLARLHFRHWNLFDLERLVDAVEAGRLHGLGDLRHLGIGRLACGSWGAGRSGSWSSSCSRCSAGLRCSALTFGRSAFRLLFFVLSNAELVGDFLHGRSQSMMPAVETSESKRRCNACVGEARNGGEVSLAGTLSFGAHDGSKC